MSRCPHCGEDHADGAHFCPVTGRPFVDVSERMIGRTLGGRYRLERAIGQGGMGTIFEATHTAIGTKVAVKLLHEPFAEKREPVQRLYREARATGAIGHPSIIKVFDVGETADGIPFLVMELLEGESLGEHVERCGPRPLGFVLDVGIQMLSALHAAHRAGIIHRDLKSDNIFLLAQAGDEPRIKILDFGISKFTTPEAESLRLTQTGSVLGTPYYMAPEQARGLKDLDQRIDIYSAGVILYELLLGTIPHRSSNYNALLIEILTQDVQPFRELRPDVTERLEAAVLRALARVRDQRWPDAMSLMGELAAIREVIPAAVLRGEAPLVDGGAARRGGRDSETVDFDSLPVEQPPGESGPAFEVGTGPWSGRTGRRRLALLFGAGGGAVLVGAVLALLLASGGAGQGSRPDGVDPDPVEDRAGIAPLVAEAEPLAPAEPEADPGVGAEEAVGADAGAVEDPPETPRPVTDTGASPRFSPGTKAGKAAKPAEAKGGTAADKGQAAKEKLKGETKLDRPMDNPF